MAKFEASIIGMGMVTSVGLNAGQTAASVRAGLSGASESAVRDQHFDPMVLCTLPDDALAPLADGIGTTALRQTRMLRLGAPALQEALGNIQNTESIPLLLGVGEKGPEGASPVSSSFIEQLTLQAQRPLLIARSRIIDSGRASGLIAIKEAMALLGSGVPHVLAGGIDTYLDLRLLATLDREGRILGPRRMDGFIPGEGAAFVLLSKASASAGETARICNAALGYEEGHIYSDAPYRGDGLAATLAELFDGAGAKPKIASVFAGFNGESFNAKEWGVAFLRNGSRFEERHAMAHPVDCIGDTGAALGPIMVCLAAIGQRKGYVSGPSLIWCASDYGPRAAVMIDQT